MRPLIALAILLACSTAHAHEIDAYLTPGGINFVEAQLPSYVPRTLAPPAFQKTLATCPGGAEITALQHSTDVDLEVHDLDLSVPRAGILRLEMTFDVGASGALDIDNAYACFGVATCYDTLSIAGARAVAEFEPVIGGDGVPRVELIGFDLLVDPDDVAFNLSDCGISGIVNLVVGFARSWLVNYLTGAVEDLARQHMGPMLSQFIAGLADFEGTVGIADIDARVTAIELTGQGLHAAADVDLSTIFPAGECVADVDPGEPGSHAGTSTDLRGAGAHAGVAINLGLIDDGIYHVWRDGLLCVTDAHASALGFDVDLDLITALLGLPAASAPSLALRLDAPPRVVDAGGAGAAVTLILDGIVADLEALDADGNPTVLHLESDVAIAAAVVLDPASNGLALRLDEAVIERLEITGSFDFDAGRVHQLVSDFLIPELKDQLGNVPLTGSVLSVADYYLIPRGLGTEPGFAYAAVDFFRAPANDSRAPETAIASAPTSVVSPADAIVRVSGTDAEVPAELLRYRFRVDGAAQAPSYLRELRLGRAGITQTYEVSVSALDLASNEDPTPARATVTVDGISPSVVVTGERIGRTDTRTATIEWIAEDDLTGAENLATTIEVLKLSDPEDSLSGELALALTVPAGERAATLELPGDGLYRIEVQVADQAGNVGRSTAILTVDEPGGCSSSRPDASLALLLLLMGAWIARPRRRQPS